MSGSKLFRRNRALGYVSNHIPATVRYIQRRRENIIVTCVGRSFHTYSSSHFRLICVSGVHPDDITCLVSDKYLTYSASGRIIYAWRGGNDIRHKYIGHQKNVHTILPFGKHLIAVDDDNSLKVWNIPTEDVYLDLSLNKDEFKITAVTHPPTYVNKILLGSEQGGLQLWNLKGCRLIYTFKDMGCSKITTLEPAPAIDVVAVGQLDGTIILLNLKFDEQIMKFKQDWGSVNSITFRTDGHPIMATSSSNGNVVFWNLEQRKIVSQLTAHSDTVSTLHCFPNEPLLLTTSSDNSMKLWIFDLPDGGARLLRIREGHSAPPLCIRYHGTKGDNILSAGEDSSLRIFNTITEVLNKSMGRASYNRKASKKRNRAQGDFHLMPAIKQFTSEVTREKEWDNIVALHDGLVMATTWSFDKCKMGELKLIPEQFHNKKRTDFNSEASCLCITHCGNFVIIGYTSGDVERFNIQSGIHRHKYGTPAHSAAIRGVNCDNLNQFIVTGCSNGQIKFWPFKVKTTEPLQKLKLDDGILFFRAHRESAMLCVALDNFEICILDCDTRTVIRKFTGHIAQLTDACFSPDSRWLITTAMDCTVKVWDIPSSYMIDHFRVDKPCVSLTMSPTGDFLATAHVNCLGIYLWANKTLYSHVSLKSINSESEAPHIDLPSTVVPDTSTIEEGLNNLELEEGEDLENNYQSPEQLDDNLITMSTISTSRWQNLLNLDIIKKRNRPKSAPIKPKQAPFFLPTVSGLEIKFDIQKSNETATQSKLLMPTNFSNLTEFGQLLNDANEPEGYEKCIEYITELGPSMIDFQIKSLHPDGGGNVHVMLKFMKMIEFLFKTNRSFELAQSYLGVFLKSHGELIAESRDLLPYLTFIEEAQLKGWEVIEEKFFFSLGVVNALRNYAL